MDYQLVEGRVVRFDTYVAVQHRNSNPASHKIGHTIYSFAPRYNVSLAWVAPEHLPSILAEMARICCGKTSKKFFLAGVVNVNIWYTGNRDGENK